MTALLDIDQLLDTLESGLRQILQARGVDDPVLIGIAWVLPSLSESWTSRSTGMTSAALV